MSKYKNTGLACFRSLSEILADLNTNTKDELLNLVKMRVSGLQLLRQTLGDSQIGCKKYGGYELFFENEHEL